MSNCLIIESINTLKRGGYWKDDEQAESFKIGGKDIICDNAIYKHTQFTINLARLRVDGKSVDGVCGEWIGKTYSECLEIICGDYSYSNICSGLNRIFGLIRELYYLVSTKSLEIYEIGIVNIPSEISCLKNATYESVVEAFGLLNKVGNELNILGEFVLSRELPVLPQVPDLVVKSERDIHEMFEYAIYAETKFAKITEVLGEFMKILQVKIHFVCGINAI